MISRIVDSIDISKFQDELIELLEYEKRINLKKINKEKLTIDEEIFDLYCIKPSTILKHLLNKKNKNLKGD